MGRGTAQRPILPLCLAVAVGFLCGHFLWKFLQINLDKDFIACRKHTQAFSGAGWIFQRGGAALDKVPKANQENFLFIGIMTARKYLDTRARASHMTWAPRVPGQVVYFLGEGEEYNGDMNVVQLKGVTENDYPPQKKSFAMVKYISEHYAKDYKWIIRADDDVYMKVDELIRFLKSVNSTGFKYIGQPGFGKPIEEGKLGLSGAFCMGGPGVIMTPELVQAVAPALDGCLGHTATGHEDTELGRCITISTGTTCTTAFEMKELFYQNYQELSLPESSFKKPLGADEVRALTLHPLKSGPYVFRMDNFFNYRKLKKLESKVESLRSEIDALNEFLGREQKTVKDILASSPLRKDADAEAQDIPVKKVNLDNISMLPQGKAYELPKPAWEFIKYKRMFSSTLEAAKLEYPTSFKRRVNLHEDFLHAIKTMPEFARVKGGAQLVNETYHRLSTAAGAESIYRIKRWRNNKKHVQPIYLRRPLEKELYFQEEEDDLGQAPRPDEVLDGSQADNRPKGKPIFMLMPLFQRSAIYRRFLNMYAKVLKGYDGDIQLRVVVFTDEMGEHKLISSMTSAMIQKNTEMDIRLMFMEQSFNRGKGLMSALADLPYNSLLLFMDVDMEFTTQFLYRVSKNTVLGKNSFFPVYFVHYNPESICYGQQSCDTLLNSRREEVGLWRSFSYGIGAVYKEDLVRAGGFKTDIIGWGLEDVDFYEKCQKIDLPVLRGSDPGMIHRYHPRECNTSLPANQLQQCMDSGNAMLGSPTILYRMLSDLSAGQEV